MKKIYVKRFLEFVGFFVIVLFLLAISSKIFMPKWITSHDNYEKMIVDGFYSEKKNSLDLIFIGNSDVYSSISPMELWNDYGIASYNYSHPGTRIWMDYYNLKVVLERQKPKYIFLGTDNLFITKKSRNGDIAKSMTSMKMSKTKIEALLNKDVQPSILIKTSYVFPIIRFHSRYNDLTKDDIAYAFKNNYMPTKGFVPSTIVKGMDYKNNYMDRHHKTEKIPQKNIGYLDKIVDLCKKNNIELILFEAPSSDSWNHKRHTEVKNYALNKKLKFVDLNYFISEIGLDWGKDTKDEGNHMNLTGAIKVTKYLGKYIDSNLKLKNHKNDKKYSKWEEDYNNYMEFKKTLLNKMKA